MADFGNIDKLLALNAAPNSAKHLLRRLASKGSVEATQHMWLNTCDFKALREIKLSNGDDVVAFYNGKVYLTEAAKKIMNMTADV